MKRLYHFLLAALDDFGNSVLCLALIDSLLLCAAIVGPDIISSRPPLYLCLLVVFFDIVMVFSVGAFRYFGLRRDTKANIKARNLLRLSFAKHYIFALHVPVFFLTLAVRSDASPNLLAELCWLFTAFAVTLTTMATTLYALGASDDAWLSGTDGHIGLPNWLSLVRMALALLLPYIYLTAPFGAKSIPIASFLLIAAIASDGLDGLIARNTKQITKLGKALDPLCDKLIFYPAAISFFLMAYVTAPTAQASFTLTFELRGLLLGLVVFRDLVFVAWFTLFYHRLANGLGAGLFDKLRAICIYAWLSFTAVLALAPSLPGSSDALLALVGSAANLSLIASACLSLVSIPVGFIRWQHSLRT